MITVDDPVDPRLEVAEIHRRVFQSGGPAILFTNVKGCRFPLASNLFGDKERSLFLFRHTIENVKRAIELKIDPKNALRNPGRYWSAPWTAWRMRPKIVGGGPAIRHAIRLDELPQMVSWPRDGGPFVTLPQVYTEHPDSPGIDQSNLGMYRIQLAGNEYDRESEVGLHYQIHRGIGVHHQAAIRRNEPFRVNVFVGGAPAMTLAAVMPLPEGMSELTFAGALAGHRIPMIRRTSGLRIYADADFCIVGQVRPGFEKPEGPFGDHLGYYSLTHPFPVMEVEKVYCREGAIWPFTVVGRPPQEDTAFGELIHEITGPVIPTVIHGVKGVHAVDAAGVHPLLLAIGSERYMPFANAPRPAEILTQANAILGQGQLSLAKYLLIVNGNDDPALDVHDIAGVFRHLLERIDWRRDVHFHTETTIDTLDYSGSGLNRGSKVVLAAVGPKQRELPTVIEGDLRLPEGFRNPKVCLPGVLALEARFDESSSLGRLESLPLDLPVNRFPLVVVVDDSDFVAQSLRNFLWVTFTRSNPASDITGVAPFTRDKHWGCEGSLLIDSRIKPHHAPVMISDPEVVKRVDALAAQGGPLAKYL